MAANLRLTAAFGALLAAAPLSAEETARLKEVTVTASSDTVAERSQRTFMLSLEGKW